MTSIPRALFRGLVSQLHPKMLLLTLVPFGVAALLWAGLLGAGWEPMVNALQHGLTDSTLATWISRAALHMGLDQVTWQWQRFAAPVLLALLLVPAIALSVVIIIGLVAAPVAVRHVGCEYPLLLPRARESFLASAWNTLRTAFMFLALWLVSMPLWLIPPLGLVVPLVLLGWLTYRVMIFDALALHADAGERRAITHARRWELWLLGSVVAALGAVPTLIWIGGAAGFVFLPLFAMITLWLYVLVFTYSALVFAHFGLDALARNRQNESERIIPS